MSKITYAEKHDELDFIRDHDEEIGVYRNKRTSEIIFCRKERVGYLEVSDIFLQIEEDRTKKKTITNNSRGAKLFIDEKQMDLFK